MPKFSFIARDKATGKKITGIEDNIDKDALITKLQARGLIVTDINIKSKRFELELKQKVTPVGLKRAHFGINYRDLSIFCRQLATLLGAGVTISEALTIISKQLTSRRLYNAIDELKKDMESGLSLHEAMDKKPKVFSKLWVHLVESGEASGNLAIILSRLASYLERNAQFRTKILSSVMYPVILLFVGLGALLFLTIKIIPTFANLFSSFDIQLPALTRMLIGTSNFIRKYIFFIILVAGAAVFFFKKYITYSEGRRRYENFQFRLPIFGEFFRGLIIERFTSEMSTLVESGVPILYALEITERSVNNLVMSDVIRNVKENVRRGHSLSIPMEEGGFFEPMVVQMVRIGEEIGDLSGMFKKLNSYYQEYVETFLTRLTTMFEPIMLIFIGAVVGIMVVGMFLPIFQLSKIGMG